MAYRYVDLQTDLKARTIRNQGGTYYDTSIKLALNTSLFRISREALWRTLRRSTTFNTDPQYSTGTISATNNSSSFTGSSLNWLTQNVYPGRRLTIQGSNLRYVVQTVTGENAFTTQLAYDGTTASGLTYTLFGREEYNLPVQTGRVALLWHEDFGYPYKLRYVPEDAFFESGTNISIGQTPMYYRMWGEDDVIEPMQQASALRIASSASGDTSINVTVWGLVSNYPDQETITTNATNGTTAVTGTKTFSRVDRVAKDATTTGRITLDSGSGTQAVAVLPAGGSTATIQYKKIQVWPLPLRQFPMNVRYYQECWRMVNDNDVHPLGQDFDEAILCLAAAKLKYQNSQAEGDRWMTLYQDEVQSLKKHNADHLDEVPILRRRRDTRGQQDLLQSYLSYQQLGGAYGPMVPR